MTLLEAPVPSMMAVPTAMPNRLPLPVLPSTAPFTPAQRAWLNGFLAGLLNTEPAGGNGSPATESHATGAAAPAVEADVEEDFPWHEPSMALDERLKLAEGAPVARQLMAAMAQLDCGACGYVCKTYGEAIAEGKEKDLTRCTPGARETSRALKQLMASAGVSAPTRTPKPAATSAAGPATSPAEPGGWTRDNPFAARLLRSARLNGPGSAKDTRLIVLDLKGSGIAYKAGDALGVYPENCADLVQDVIEALHASGAEDVGGWDGQPTSLREALLRDYTISRPSPVLVELLADRATDEGEKRALIALRDDDAGIDPGLQVLDLLRRFPSARVSPDDLVSALSPLAPRLYSISSSPLAHPDEVHLTVGAVRYTNEGGRPCKGVASTFLADRVRPGMKVRVFPHPSHKFGLCEGDRPIVMVGPGTGIAPFRAFLQERAAAKSSGKSWLFFGDQKSDSDLLYRDELAQYQQDGVLTRLDTAFSRDAGPKVYVQHRMLEHAAELWSWLESGAAFYVCGDAQRMASDVDKTLRQVIATEGKLTPAQADAYVSNMVRANRYQRDVY